MATEAHKFQVGMFVIVATVIAIGAAIWLGASRFFEKTHTFVTYFSESVQGLDTGAGVKYRGVPSGRVGAIRIAADGDLIEVVMDIDTEVAKVLKGDDRMRATLELSGITGLRYIEIDRRSGEALNQAPTLTFKPEYELLPSSRSSFKAIQSALGDVYDRVMQLDLGGISNDTRAALQAANQVLRDPRVDTMLSNFKAASESASQVTKDLQEVSAKLGPAADNASHATADARQLFASLNQNLKGKELGDAIEQINRLALSAQQFVIGMQSTVERLDRTVGNLQSLTEEVRSQPSLLLFSAPPGQRRPAEGKSR